VPGQHAVPDGAAKAGAKLCLERLAGPRIETHEQLEANALMTCDGRRRAAIWT
jgi:hypothetical protein